MSRLTNKGQGAPFALFSSSSETVATAPFTSSSTLAGERFESSDGREFVIVLNGATALAAGKLVQAPPITSLHQNMATTTAVAGATTVTVTLGSTAATINQYAGGFLVINAGTGLGQTFRVASHPAANSGATLVVTLEDPVVTALATSDTKSCLLPNLYTGVVVNPTTATNTPIGVALYAIAASTASPVVAGNTATYGFIQSKGAVSCLADGTIGVGLGIMPSTGTAGAVLVADATGARIGRALQAGVTTEYRTVYIDC